MRFRSRLEARWAALFTLLGWPWEYEPDLGLDGWIPDFAIVQSPGLLVEVKPAIVPEELERHKARIEQAAPERDVLLVGASPSAAWFWRWDRFGGTWSPTALHNVARDKLLPATHAGPIAVGRLWVRAGNALQWRRL